MRKLNLGHQFLRNSMVKPDECQHATASIDRSAHRAYKKRQANDCSHPVSKYSYMKSIATVERKRKKLREKWGIGLDRCQLIH